MVAGKLHPVDDLLAPYSGGARTTAAVPAPANAPTPLTREQAHSHDNTYWWHEPEWLHRVCCEG
ncbi:hypothetical protein [Kribbella sp. NPDC049227]|uniref:hypothetical protein n=1 Tax=Kribbella sp. NPDC049227 TaxID=3364113 RepID=UPI003721F803